MNLQNLGKRTDRRDGGVVAKGSVAILALSTMALPGHALAQQAAEPAPAQTSARSLEEVVVTGSQIKDAYALPNATTGTKTDTPLMETPLSVQVISQQVLRDQNATTLDQALANVSGVIANSKLYSGWTEQIYLRGFYTNSTFRDGFRIDDPGGWNGTDTLSNIDSIEVLKGPAAILYGRVEPGGIVNLVTKKPLETPYYSFEQSIGSWNHYITSVDASNAVNDDKSLLYRVNVSYDTGKSWREGISNQRFFIAPTLQWTVSPQTQVLFDASYSHNPVVIDLATYPFDTNTDQFAPVAIDKDPAPIRYAANTTYAGVVVSHELNPDWSIKEQLRHNEVVGAYPRQPILNSVFETGGVWMFDRADYQLSVQQRTDASILDLTGHLRTAGMDHTVLVGADYYRFTTNTIELASAPGAATTWVDPAPASGLVVDPSPAWIAADTTNNLGVYLQDQVKLPKDIVLLAGLRYQRVDYSGTSTLGPISGGSGQQTVDQPQHDHATTPRFGILWHARDWLSLYATHARNFGASNGANGVDYLGNPLPPESALEDEVGGKTEFFGGKLVSSLALYNLTKTNVAAADKVHDPLGTLGYMSTIGAINSRGVEFDLQGEIRPGWNAIVAYTFDRVVITNSTPGSYWVQGYRMPDDPEHTYRLWTTYAWNARRLEGWKVGGGITWRGESLDQTNTMVSPSYGVWDAMVSYDARWGKLKKASLQLNASNLFNQVYFTGASAYGNWGYRHYGDPRSLTLSARIEL